MPETTKLRRRSETFPPSASGRSLLTIACGCWPILKKSAVDSFSVHRSEEIAEWRGVNTVTRPGFRQACRLGRDIGFRVEQPIIGVGGYVVCRDDSNSGRANVGLAVLDQHQRRGVVSLLLQHLARTGRANGLRGFRRTFWQTINRC